MLCSHHTCDIYIIFLLIVIFIYQCQSSEHEKWGIEKCIPTFSEAACCNGGSRTMVLLGRVAISIPFIVICKEEKRRENDVSHQVYDCV